VLSIDANIQYMAERALDAQMLKTKALHGTVVVQDPHTGQILALAISPRFNPNDQKHMDSSVLQNLAVSDVYEPGSTFKLVTYSAAIDAAGVKPDDIVDCQGGAITLYGRTIHDDKSDMGMGKVTVQRALEKSSDVAAVKMALKLGNAKFYQYMRAYGFGDRSGIELPSETRGLLSPVRKWSATSIGSLAIGQEVGVTPVQLAAMVSTIANGGTYLPPHVLAGENSIANGKLQAVPYRQRNAVVSPLPDGAHRVISEMTAAQMRKMMEGIVLNGTGKEAALNGYSSGGKTGTAQKIDVVTHTYSKTQYVASFAGVAPISNPAITVAVVIDSPGGASYYGAAVSAPVFREIAQQTLEYLQIPYDRDVKAVRPQPVVMDTADSHPAERVGQDGAMFAAVGELPKDDPLRSAAEATPAAARPSVVPAGTVAIVSAQTSSPASAATPAVIAAAAPVATPGPGMVAVPQFSGKTLRAAAEQAMAAGLRLEAVGSGLARSQEPAPGTVLQAGAMVAVHFSR
jgi:cell division protein FtsI (penicillin-binding protein 3)